MVTVNFESLGMPVFSGRSRGVAARKKLGIGVLDASAEPIRVIVPTDVYTITNSYFLGLFGPSVRHFKRKDRFLAHYNFEAPPRILAKLDDWIQDALRAGIDREDP